MKNLAGEEYPPGVMGVDMQRVYNALDPEDEVLLEMQSRTFGLGRMMKYFITNVWHPIR